MSEHHSHPREHREGTSQETERKLTSMEHSQTGEPRGRDKLGDRKKPLKCGALTNWKAQRKGQVIT
jgi:hypothetical protein